VCTCFHTPCRRACGLTSGNPGTMIVGRRVVATLVEVRAFPARGRRVPSVSVVVLAEPLYRSRMRVARRSNSSFHITTTASSTARHGSNPAIATLFNGTREADTIRSMRKEEFERRAAEMKARMLAQRNRQAEEPSATPVRKSRGRVAPQSPEVEVQALQKRVKELEAENLRLRRQLATIANRVTPSSQSSADSVREQQHNFFKYSNVRRY
jgi:hypothetical protein